MFTSYLQATCGQLSSLDLRMCTKVTGTAILAIADNCPHLTALYLERAGRISDECVHALAAGCSSLRTLDLGWCEVGDSALEALSRGCPLLQECSMSVLKEREVKGVRGEAG